MWQLILDIFNFNTVQLRDERYDGVIHLVTAAIGAEKFYTTVTSLILIFCLNFNCSRLGKQYSPIRNI